MACDISSVAMFLPRNYMHQMDSSFYNVTFMVVFKSLVLLQILLFSTTMVDGSAAKRANTLRCKLSSAENRKVFTILETAPSSSGI